MADIVRPGEQAGGTLNASAMPKNYNLSIYKGDFMELFVTVKDSSNVAVDLTGSTPKASLKSNYEDSAQKNLTCTLTGITGQVRIYLSSPASNDLTPGDYIWDFQVTAANGDTRTYLTGDVVVYNEVTQVDQ